MDRVSGTASRSCPRLQKYCFFCGREILQVSGPCVKTMLCDVLLHTLVLPVHEFSQLIDNLEPRVGLN